MRGYKQDQQEDMFSYVSMEDSIPKEHPLRKILYTKLKGATAKNVLYGARFNGKSQWFSN